MPKNKQTPVIAYIVTFLVALIFGTGAIWQVFNLELAQETLEFEKQKLKFEQQRESINMHSMLNETMDKITSLNKEFKAILFKKVDMSDAIRKEYTTRYNLLLDNLERTEKCLANMEGSPI